MKKYENEKISKREYEKKKILENEKTRKTL